MHWKGFIAEHNTWEREENFGNVKEIVVDFEERISAEVRRQEKLEIAEE